MVEVMKIVVTSFRRSHASTATLSAPNPAAGHHQPSLCWRLLDTPGQVWVSLLWGHCSFLLGPGMHKVLFVPSRSLLPQFCVSSGSPMVGLLASKRACAIPKSAAPSHTQGCSIPLPLWQSTADLYLHRRHSNTVLSVSAGSLGPGAHKVCLISLSISGRNGA